MQKMRKRLIGFLVVCAGFMLFNCPASMAASEIESLVDILVNKGVISRGDAIQVIEDAENEAKMQQVNAIKQGPKWLANTTFKGDLRIRHQYESKEDSSSRPRHRFRTRFRYGFTNKINNTLKVGARFATGSTSDPRSTNQTWNDGFNNWNFNVDEAYFDWKPFTGFQIIGGKREVKKLMIRNSDLIWDGDLTFDGGTLRLAAEVADGFKLVTNAGIYVLDQEKFDDDKNENPYMASVQVGYDLKNKLDWGYFKSNLGLSYIAFGNVDHHAILDAKGAGESNTLNADNTYKYGYDVIHSTAKFEFNWGGAKNKTYAMKFFGDYLYNPDPQDIGFLAGVKIGYAKVGKKFGDWQLGYNWRYLEDDAFLDVFSDSDAYGGETNIKGHEATLVIGLAKNVTLGFDYYFSEPISGSSRNSENLLQTDFKFKF